MALKLCFMDWETQGPDLTITGSMNYVLDPSTRPLILSYAAEEGEVMLWHNPGLRTELVPEVYEFINAYPKGEQTSKGAPEYMWDVAGNPEGYFIAWNMGFDRAVFQQIATPELGFPKIDVEQTLDAMAQGQASSLPGSLDMAGRALGLGNKTSGGKAVMKRFADPDAPMPGSPEHVASKGGYAKGVKEAINLWGIYIDYALQDTALMRDIWYACRQLDGGEWEEYWVSERINDRGIGVDLEVCRGASAYREEELAHVAEECERITKGEIKSPTLTKKINEWLYQRLPDDLAEHMVKARDEDGNVTRLTGAKQVITNLLEEMKISEAAPADEVLDLVELLQFGRSSSAIKFEKMAAQAVDGRLCGSYVFNGAGQTGRFSSRGIQVHNLPRAHLKNELDIMDMVAESVPIEQLRKVGPVSSVLSKLVRPTMIAEEGKTFVWHDWSSIEARVTPWLAKSREADNVALAPFINGEDLYVLNAETIFDVPKETLTARLAAKDPEAKAMRQAAKVAVLALGFSGGVGAYKSMARGYGMAITDEEAQTIVDGWRERNRWAKRFAVKCEQAAFSALSSPLKTFTAGRLSYIFIPGLLRGTLVCYLPDQRPIVYPSARVEKKEKFGHDMDVITYLRGMGRKDLWRGLQVENGVQATAASILRQTLVRLDKEEKEADIILHTHDEILGEVPVDGAEAFDARLSEVMNRGFDWTEGLPIASEGSTSWYYTKAND